MEALILLVVIVLVTVFVGRYTAKTSTAFDKKLEELCRTTLQNVSPDGEVTCNTYRVQRVFAPGFENHRLILVCLDNNGYWSMHYNEYGVHVETIYVPFRSPDKPGTVEGPSLPLRQATVGTDGTNHPASSPHSGFNQPPSEGSSGNNSAS